MADFRALHTVFVNRTDERASLIPSLIALIDNDGQAGSRCFRLRLVFSDYDETSR